MGSVGERAKQKRRGRRCRRRDFGLMLSAALSHRDRRREATQTKVDTGSLAPSGSRQEPHQTSDSGFIDPTGCERRTWQSGMNTSSNRRYAVTNPPTRPRKQTKNSRPGHTFKAKQKPRDAALRKATFTECEEVWKTQKNHRKSPRPELVKPHLSVAPLSRDSLAPMGRDLSPLEGEGEIRQHLSSYSA